MNQAATPEITRHSEPSVDPGEGQQRHRSGAVGRGRLFGALVLAAFVLYGAGSAMADAPLGLALVVLNSVAVAGAGVIGFRLVGARSPLAGRGYLAGRLVEAVFLAGGVALVTTDIAEADHIGYLIGMLALGLTSVPFCLVLGRGRWLPDWLARWGVLGYLGLAAGAAIELATGWEVSLYLAAPGGLFELVLGLFLVRRGFAAAGDRPAG